MPENLNKEPEDIFEGIDEPKHSIKKENSEESEEKPKEKTIPQKENKNLAKLKKSLSVFFSFKISKEDWKYLGILFLIGLILDGIIILYSIQKLDFQSDIK